MTKQDLDLKSQEPCELLTEIRTLIEDARRQTAVAVNKGLTLLYWRIGSGIHREVLGGERAAHGQPIVVTLSRQLVEDQWPGLFRKEPEGTKQFGQARDEQESSEADPRYSVGIPGPPGIGSK